MGELGMELPEAVPVTDPPAAQRPRTSPARLAAVGLAAAAVAVVMWGGYGHRWPWTGINGRTATLWDWLHLLLLPLAFGLLPVLLSKETRLRSGHKRAVSASLIVFGVFVAAGYAVPWGWTGFPGNRLWDWLELLALPLAITLIPVMDELRLSWNRRDSVAAVIALGVFAVIVTGGYLGDWSWTGFPGNTLWDWLHLLLLPLLLPTVVVPRLAPRMKGALRVSEADGSESSQADGSESSQAAAGTVEEKPAQAGPASPEQPEPPPAPGESLDHVEQAVGQLDA